MNNIPINEKIHKLANEADLAFDNKDTPVLKKIFEDCFFRIEDESYNTLERGLLAYHGATTCSNYLYLKYANILHYTDEKNNEADFEMCFLLFRKSIEFLSEYKKQDNDKASEEDSYYAYSYLLMAYTNMAVLLQKSGRFIRALFNLRIGVANDFPMSVGNFASFILEYASYEYEEENRVFFINEAYHLLSEVLDYDHQQIHTDAKEHFYQLLIEIEKQYKLEFLNTPHEFNEFSTQETQGEQSYKKWCLENVLYINTLNDVFIESVSAADTLHLPNMVFDLNETPRYHGLFNQIKQEYVSARYMIYDALHNSQPHFSDKGVFLVNTLDYPLYGLGLEKIKYAYRSLYSLFDRMAFLINDYFDLGIKDRDVSYKNIWKNLIGRGKNAYKPKVLLKDKMSYNLPLRGVYWLCKDIGKQKVKHLYLEPSIEQISNIRHHLEHRYLKVHVTKDALEHAMDPLAFSISIDDLEEAVMELISYVREGILLMSLAIHVEENKKKIKRDTEQKTINIPLDSYEYDWKRLFCNKI